MKFKFKILVVFTLTLVLLAGCRKADRISHNISREADDMNITLGIGGNNDTEI